MLIRTIPHGTQRYSTVGDYFDHSDVHLNIEVVVSDMGDQRMEFLVGIHEAIEAGLMKFAGIPLQASTDFDVPYEADRDLALEASFRRAAGFGCPCDITPTSEPGDDIHAPYYRAHQFATAVERMLAVELGVDWKAYEDRCNSLP
jgi:hypothetical protein